ncbi:hypothetical protein [Pseudomonas orientalis]|uniref:hypothetical protein n=1 Tax=Pseudomonas orientalis TaxID=76758 RepID=UPI0034D63DC5
MPASGFPRKLFWLAIIATFVCSILALASRFRLEPTINGLFRTLSLDNQSLIEHFLGSIAASAIALFAIIFISAHTTKVSWKKSRTRKPWFISIRRKLLKAFSKVFVAQWLLAISGVYIAVSFGWEYGQMKDRGFFQIGQFAMDILGGISFCAVTWLSLRKEYGLARRKRRLVFV